MTAPPNPNSPPENLGHKDTLTQCPLCSASGPLCESHVIPHFVIEWLRATSATGYIRCGDAPNLRVQDGFKERLLCPKCEGMLGAWERETAERLFKPYHSDDEAVLRYEGWFAQFCASLCWRVLFILRRMGLDDLSEAQLTLVSRALDFWRDFMFGRRQHPGEFELHVLPLSSIETMKGFDNVPSNMNRYFAREVEIDIGSTSESVFVQAKLCKLMVFGFVQMPYSREWKGTRVRMRRGTIGGPRTYYVPRSLADYMVDRATVVRDVQAAMSDRQREKIISEVQADPERARQSGTFEAMSQDVKLFGPAAFRQPKSRE